MKKGEGEDKGAKKANRHRGKGEKGQLGNGGERESRVPLYLYIYMNPVVFLVLSTFLYKRFEKCPATNISLYLTLTFADD